MKRLALFYPLILSGCVIVGTDYQAPETSAPKQWSKVHNALPNASTINMETWWHSFNDPILNQLVVDAINANLDLQQTQARIKDARAQRTSTIAAGLPSLSTQNSLSRRLNSTGGGALGMQQGGGIGFGGQAINLMQIGIDAQWEIDFFGGVQRAVEAAEATIESEIEHRHDVVVILLGDVARNYIELRGNQQLIEITIANLSNQQDALNLLKIRQQAGLIDNLAIAQAEAELANLQAQLPSYETSVKQSVHALSLLLAKQPDALMTLLEPVKPIPQVKNTVLPNLPSTLLQRRPDIRYAERQLAIANAQIGVAESELYPKFNLAAFLGLQNTSMIGFTPIGKSWSLGSTLTAPLFNWGRINANIKSKEAQYQQTFLSYQKTVLTAFKEVEDALVAYDKEQKKQQSLQQAVAANQQALQLANERYKRGLTDFINVLNSQQALYQSQSTLASSTAKIASNVVTLYKVLGGGWSAF